MEKKKRLRRQRGEDKASCELIPLVKFVFHCVLASTTQRLFSAPSVKLENTKQLLVLWIRNVHTRKVSKETLTSLPLLLSCAWCVPLQVHHSENRPSAPERSRARSSVNILVHFHQVLLHLVKLVLGSRSDKHGAPMEMLPPVQVSLSPAF